MKSIVVKNICFVMGMLVFLSLIVLELYLILDMNGGFFVYTLDDPYIHMALAENIIKGHYGINLVEYSAPSSSIIWPFILAPIASFELAPLILNIIFSIITIFLFTKIFEILFSSLASNKKALISLFTILLIFATNIVGLIFLGMEHSLQLMFVVLIVYGLLTIVKLNEVKLFLSFSIIFAPLIRYENLAISFAALIFLFIRGYRKKAFHLSLVIIFLLSGFSLFLLNLGLNPFPTSVLAKSSVVETKGTLHSLIINLAMGYMARQGKVLYVSAFCLLLYLIYNKIYKKDEIKRQIGFITLFALILHFIVGRYGWFNRYEIYIWAFFLLFGFYICADKIKSFMEFGNTNEQFFKVAIISLVFLIITSSPYIDGLFPLSIASNNIYEQQYQMHRFVVDYYNEPVAINDLGYVSYKNPNYVLDLWGLASLSTLKNRKNSPRSSEWMNELILKHNIDLVMIYESWFGNVPSHWIKIGTLNLSKTKITPARSEVDFYATNLKAYPKILNKIHSFMETLPHPVKFELAQQ